MESPRQNRDVRVFADLSPRRYRTGMWSHVLHRVSGVAIVVFLLMHIFEVTSVVRGGGEGFELTMSALATKPFVIGEFMLFLAITFHSINGIRLLAHDLGWGVRKQKTLFWAAFVISAIIIAGGSYFFIMRFLAYPWSV